jgi:hypothetical protein
LAEKTTSAIMTGVESRYFLRINGHPHDDGQKTYASQQPIQLLGTISNTGETFVSDKGGKNWTIVNPDAVKGHEGHHVLLTANVDADKNEVNVVSLKMAKK